MNFLKSVVELMGPVGYGGCCRLLQQCVRSTKLQNYRLRSNKNKDNFTMVMGLNNQGWAENMDGVVNPPERVRYNNCEWPRGGKHLRIQHRPGHGWKAGGNSWNNYGGINDRGEAVGYSETADPDPSGEDICGFHTHLTCVPFLWREGHMRALPTLGGNNGQASAINNRGEVVGFAEDGAVDPTCPAGKTNNRIRCRRCGKEATSKLFPLLGNDKDGLANGINNRGQAVGYTGTCMTAHAVMWKDDNVYPLKVGGFQFRIRH